MRFLSPVKCQCVSCDNAMHAWSVCFAVHITCATHLFMFPCNEPSGVGSTHTKLYMSVPFQSWSFLSNFKHFDSLHPFVQVAMTCAEDRSYPHFVAVLLGSRLLPWQLSVKLEWSGQTFCSLPFYQLSVESESAGRPKCFVDSISYRLECALIRRCWRGI